MPQESGREETEGAADALGKVAAAIRATGRDPGSVSLEKAIGKASADGRAKRAALEAVSVEVGSPEFLIDMWCAGKTAGQVAEALERAEQKLRRTVQVKVHPDNLPELLDGSLKSGFVFLPKQLLTDLYRLGEGAIGMLEEGHKSGPEIESTAMRVLDGAADWVRYCRRRWGLPPGSELVPVRPASKQEEAQPDKTTDPPF